jgi:gliding motility-associated-like protein
VHTITTTLLPSDSTFSNATSCNPADTGILSITSPNQFTCDSVHTITTTLLPSDSTFANATSCNPLDTGVVSVTNPNQFSCDSVHTITTTYIPTSVTTENITACDSAFVLGSWRAVSNSFNDTLIGGAVNGCDSIFTYNVTINQSSQTIETIVACDSALVQGNWFFSSQVFVFNNLNVQGCDSSHTTTLAINNSNVIIDNITACDNYTWIDGINYTTSNNAASFTLQNTTGCDSLLNLNLTILPSSSEIIDLSFCPYELPVTLPSGLVIDGSQNIYTDSLLNGNSCDSIISYDVIVSDEFNISPNYIVAQSGDSVAFTVNNENNDMYFSYISSNGDNCEAYCQSYFVYPNSTVNNYYFTIVDSINGCVFEDTLRIDLSYYSELNVPNIFTPNGDGQNDIYYCYGKDIIQYQLEIFDRWGGRMFISNDLNYGWDGIFNNFAVESGIYVAIIRATGIDGQKYELSQNIKLVR